MERLSGLDASFLYLETPEQLMHVCGVISLDPTTMPDGYSFDAFRDELSNPYMAGSAEAQAWDMGREEGRTKQKPAEPTEAQIEAVNSVLQKGAIFMSREFCARLVRAAFAAKEA